MTEGGVGTRPESWMSIRPGPDPVPRLSAAATQDLVDDFGDRPGGVDGDRVFGKVFPGLVLAEDQGAFGGFRTPFAGSAVEAVVQGCEVDFEHEDRVEEGDEALAVACAAAEEGGGVGLVGDEGADLVLIPDVVAGDEIRIGAVLRTHERVQPCAGDGIALIGQCPVAMHGVMAAPLQFGGGCGLAAAGAAFDEIIPDAHFRLVFAAAAGADPRLGAGHAKRLSWPGFRAWPGIGMAAALSRLRHPTLVEPLSALADFEAIHGQRSDRERVDARLADAQAADGEGADGNGANRQRRDRGRAGRRCACCLRADRAGGGDASHRGHGVPFCGWSRRRGQSTPEWTARRDGGSHRLSCGGFPGPRRASTEPDAAEHRALQLAAVVGDRLDDGEVVQPGDFLG